MLKGPPPRDSQKSLKLFEVDLTIAGSPKIWSKYIKIRISIWKMMEPFWSVHVWPGLHQTVYTLLPNAKQKNRPPITYRTNDTGRMFTYNYIKLYCQYNNRYLILVLATIYITWNMCTVQMAHIVNICIYIYLCIICSHRLLTFPPINKKQHLVECICCLHLPFLGFFFCQFKICQGYTERC